MKQLLQSPARGNGLVMVNDDQVVTTSLKVAEYFGKPHKDVLKSIRTLGCSTEFTGRNFSPCFYFSELRNNVKRKLPMYYMTRDGFTLLVMGFTGKVAARFKEAYINAFNAMEQKLRESQSSEKATIAILEKLCAQVAGNMEARSRQLASQFGGFTPYAISAPYVSCRGSLEEQLEYILTTLDLNTQSGMVAWAKCSALEKENQRMVKAIGKAAKGLEKTITKNK